MKSRIEIKRICAWCGKEFIAYKTTTNCCSHKCGNALYKKRKRDAAIIANNNLTEKIVTEKPIEKIKDKPFLTITETAIYLGVTRPTIYGYLKRGDLKATRIGTKFLLRKPSNRNKRKYPSRTSQNIIIRDPYFQFNTSCKRKSILWQAILNL